MRSAAFHHNKGMATLPASIRTARLELRQLTGDDLEDIHRIYSDPATWLHLPSGRHTDVSQSLSLIERAGRSWVDPGLGYWAVRTITHTAALPGHSFIGSGGVNLCDGGVWNLGFRLCPDAWGNGFASELATAALYAASECRPEMPVTARVLSNNPASAAVVRAVGLELVWEGATAAESGTDVTRRVYADRPLAEPALAWLIANA